MAHEHEESHEHDPLRWLHSDVDDATLDALRTLHPSLATHLEKTRKVADLPEDQRALLADEQRELEKHDAWTPGYHAAGDRCATCGEAVESSVFEDRFEQGALPYGAFIGALPVHLRAECIEGFAAKHPRLAPRDVDRLKRELTRDLARPSPALAMFFRHDVLAQEPFELEDWANSVAAANDDKLDRATVRDIERLIHWVHHRMFHH